MFNIKFKGKFRDESQLKKRKLPLNSTMFKEPDSMMGVFFVGMIISLPIIVLISIGFIYKIGSFKKLKVSYIIISIILTMILLYLHELIHAICFPTKVEKEIWIKPNEGALFVYCNEAVSKKRFIWICIAPNLILGVIPFMGFLFGLFDFNDFIKCVIGIISWIMITSGIGDYLNIYNALRQVPKKAYIINNGFNSFWYKYKN